MPINIPTFEDVQSMFCQAIEQAIGPTEPLDRQDFSRHSRSTLNPVWDQLAPGIEHLSVSPEISLIRGQFRVIIDNHRDGQAQAIKGHLSSLASKLSAIVAAGAAVSSSFEFPPPQSVAGGQEVICLFQALVQG